MMTKPDAASLRFEKFHGCGNDFIMIDVRDQSFSLEPAFVHALCHRRLGIGADGLITLESDPRHDFSMRYFNADGNESTLCGNGGRCITWFAHRHGLCGMEASFMAIDGLHRSIVLAVAGNKALIRLKMRDVDEIQVNEGHWILNTGSPHHVQFRETVASIDVKKEGREIRNSPLFSPKGINVNFVEKKGNELFVRTYERGVEDETLSCGTGVTASALVFAQERGLEAGSIPVLTPGGTFKVSFTRSTQGFQDIWLEGEAAYVFTGNLIL